MKDATVAGPRPSAGPATGQDVGGGECLGRQIGDQCRTGPAGGVEDHTARPGLESMPDTVVTRPCSPGSARSRATAAAERLQDEVVERPTGEGHAPGQGRRALGVEPELRCCTRTAAGKHE